MIVQCSTCYKMYDDAECWTMCPHGPLGTSHYFTYEYGPLTTTPSGHTAPVWSKIIVNYCSLCDTLAEIHGLCQHQLSEIKNVELSL